ncbi:MAG: ABC transporter permease subunit [Clostridiales bacterium]|nr:ABC transporter permease subunit [Clostridiales bacterium]
MDRKYRRVVLLSPITLLYSLLIGGGFWIILKESFGIIPILGFDEMTFSYYLKVMHMNGFFHSVLFALYLAVVSSVISMVIGTWIAYRLTRSKNQRLKSVINLIMGLGIMLPYLYMVFITMLFLSQSGLISRVIYMFNVTELPSDFPNLLYGRLGIGIIIVYVLKGIPFVFLLTLNVMSQISINFEQVAMTLGSNNKQIFKKIYLPLSRDTIVWSGMVLFAYDLGSFEVPYIFGNLKSKSFSVMLYSEYLKPSIISIPTTMAMTVILFGISIVSVILFALFVRNVIRRLHR